MKKSATLSILAISVIILLSINMISASLISDTWQKITGKVVASSGCPKEIFSFIKLAFVKKAIMYDIAGQTLLDKGSYRGIPLVFINNMTSGYTYDEIGARIVDLDPNGCEMYYGHIERACKNPVIELSRNKLQDWYKIKIWTNTRTRSDGSKMTPLPADYFKNYGEFIRSTLEHEYQHTLIRKKAGETIGQYEDRVEKKVNAVLMKVRAAYDKNCKYI